MAERILIVEDEEKLARFIELELLHEGYAVEKAADGRDGLEKAQAGGVDALETQPPDAEGMLAVYRPVDVVHAGTLEDPIPWVYGMDCHSGLYYSHGGRVYLCNADMIPCVWEPGTEGLWQWTLQEEGEA